MEPGGFDMQQIFAAAQQMQSQLANAQQALADSEVTGTAGGGAVRAELHCAAGHQVSVADVDLVARASASTTANS